ncbi:taurine dioxygenase [Sphingomonas sp. YR710]|uniref:TauD/TfdA dioxygenase family protein n=1 Tax=Sphingomonas sp. YR710 TaxID=1882773 RepID=UPI0008923716|nr:TauD/TfdA family dioxygenase [Sphingomonas sp. YR710]SDC66350.1 taurine dioxygenase [Sphingomonas sp. YR710]
MAELEVRDLTPLFGAEIIGFEPKLPLDDATLQKLRTLFNEKGMLVFRNLETDKDFQTYLSYALIEKEPPAVDPTVNPKRESVVSNKVENAIAPVGRLLFHSDMMWSKDILELLSLYGLEVEQPATPTMFVSATHAWKTLPADLRARVEGRFAEHVHDLSYERSGGDADVLTAKFQDDDSVKLPIAYRHPRTGETLLYICQQMTSGIADLPKAESDELLEALFDHLYNSQPVFEHHWRKGDLVVWDNLALQHARPNVVAVGPARTLRKTFAPMPESFKTRTPQFAQAGA